MLIQCQHCNATFKIDESKIPDQDAFVRCSRCSNPIPLNKQEQSAILKSAPQIFVECDNCNAGYSIPLDRLEDERAKVRCGKCGNVFQVSKSAAEVSSTEDMIEPDEDLADEGFDDFAAAEDDLDLNDITIPDENQIEMDSLYDNIDDDTGVEDSDLDADSKFEMQTDFGDDDLDEETMDSSEEYLDSISLSSQVGETDAAESEDDLDFDAVSAEERHKLFLKPQNVGANGDIAGTNGNDHWPEIEDETETLEIGREISDFTGLDEMGDMPDLEKSAPGGDIARLHKEKKKGKSRWLILILIIILALAAAGAWFYLRYYAGSGVSPQQTEKFGDRSKLKILEPLKGRMIFNKSDKVNVFLLEGQVRNNYPDGIVSWIEVKGALYDKQNTKISEALTYAGINLTNTQLEDWNANRINSYLKYQSDKIKRNNAIKPGQAAPFQIIFFDVPKTIQKLEARINRFGRSGL